MNNTSTLQKKLSAYAAAAGALFAMSESAQAQIVYTDIPDEALTWYTEHYKYVLDLNNDGINDFSFKALHWFSASTDMAEVTIASTYVTGSARVNAKFLSGYAPFCLPYAMNSGDGIDAGNNWILPSDGTSDYQHGAFEYCGVYLGHHGYWIDAGDKFVGLRVKAGNDYYYGWARLNVINCHHMIIKDYAYNSTPNSPIHAGETGLTNCVDAYEPNNSFIKAKSAWPTQETYGQIYPAGDNDYFKFVVPVIKNNIRITLSDLPKNYNLYLYDSNQNLLDQSTNAGTNNDTIVLNNATSDLHYIKVKANKPTAIDSVHCYTLLIETSSNPFRISGDLNETLNDGLQLYPNPAADELTISGINEPSEIFIYDMDGRELFTQQVSDISETMVAIDIEQLKPGFYYLQMKNEQSTMVKKFVVQR